MDRPTGPCTVCGGTNYKVEQPDGSREWPLWRCADCGNYTGETAGEICQVCDELVKVKAKKTKTVNDRLEPGYTHDRCKDLLVKPC